jgi:GR25 family glycosyltransferase involved in LPS biosynthesis
VNAESISVILINLDQSMDRLARMTSEFDRVGLAFQRFAGVRGTELPPNIRPFFCGADGQIVSPLKVGEIGCYASHLAIWRGIAVGGYKAPALICEDDLALPADLACILARTLAKAPSGWDIIRLAFQTKRTVARVASLDSRYDLVRYSRHPQLSGAYLISRQGASKLLKPSLREHPIDGDLSRPWVFGLESYGVYPAPIAHLAEDSLIDGMGRRVFPRHTLWTRAINAFTTEKVARLLYGLRTLGVQRWTSCALQNGARKLSAHRSRSRKRLIGPGRYNMSSE